jgi:hypothetical protein
MDIARVQLTVFFLLAVGAGYGQGTVPTFQFKAGQTSLTLPGTDFALNVIRTGTSTVEISVVPPCAESVPGSVKEVWPALN